MVSAGKPVDETWRVTPIVTYEQTMNDDGGISEEKVEKVLVVENVFRKPGALISCDRFWGVAPGLDEIKDYAQTILLLNLLIMGFIAPTFGALEHDGHLQAADVRWFGHRAFPEGETPDKLCDYDGEGCDHHVGFGITEWGAPGEMVTTTAPTCRDNRSDHVWTDAQHTGFTPCADRAAAGDVLERWECNTNKVSSDAANNGQTDSFCTYYPGRVTTVEVEETGYCNDPGFLEAVKDDPFANAWCKCDTKGCNLPSKEYTERLITGTQFCFCGMLLVIFPYVGIICAGFKPDSEYENVVSIWWNFGQIPMHVGLAFTLYSTYSFYQLSTTMARIMIPDPILLVGHNVKQSAWTYIYRSSFMWLVPCTIISMLFFLYTCLCFRSRILDGDADSEHLPGGTKDETVSVYLGKLNRNELSWQLDQKKDEDSHTQDGVAMSAGSGDGEKRE